MNAAIEPAIGYLTRREGLLGLSLLLWPAAAFAAQNQKIENYFALGAAQDRDPDAAQNPNFKAFVAWAIGNARALKTSDPSAPVDDLAPLRGIVGDARIVGVGESFHGGREFLGLRHRAARFLIERLGFDAVALESGLPESRLAYDYVLGGEKPAGLWEDGFTWGFGDLSETRALVEWIRAYNARSGRRVRFYGMDVAGAKGSWRGAAEQVFGYLDKVDPDPVWRADIRARLMPLLAKFERPGKTAQNFTASNNAFATLPLAERTAVAAYVNELFDRFENLRLTYLRASSSEDYDWARQIAVNLRASDNLVTGWEAKDRLSPAVGTARDITMAANIEWMRQRGRVDGGVVVLAHNDHVQATSRTLPGLIWGNAGTFLRDRLGAGYRTIGFTFGSGTMPTQDPKGPKTLPRAESDSIDGALARIGLPLCIIDLRRLPKSGPAAQWLSAPRKQREQDLYFAYDQVKSWDGLIYVVRVDASPPLVSS